MKVLGSRGKNHVILKCGIDPFVENSAPDSKIEFLHDLWDLGGLLEFFMVET